MKENNSFSMGCCKQVIICNNSTLTAKWVYVDVNYLMEYKYIRKVFIH